MRLIAPNSIVRPFALPALEAAIIADSPIAWWKLDETSGTTAADSIGSLDLTHTNGPLVNQASLLGDGSGKSVSYDGVNDASMANAVPAGLGATFTIEFMLRTGPQASFDAYDGLVTIGSVVLETAFMIGTQGPGAPGTTGNLISFNANGECGYIDEVATNTVYHVALTHDAATNILKMYRNGVEVWSVNVLIANGVPVVAPTAEIKVGYDAANETYGQVRMQHFALYSTVLSAARILAHAQASGMI